MKKPLAAVVVAVAVTALAGLASPAAHAAGTYCSGWVSTNVNGVYTKACIEGASQYWKQGSVLVYNGSNDYAAVGNVYVEIFSAAPFPITCSAGWVQAKATYTCSTQWAYDPNPVSSADYTHGWIRHDANSSYTGDVTSPSVW